MREAARIARDIDKVTPEKRSKLFLYYTYDSDANSRQAGIVNGGEKQQADKDVSIDLEAQQPHQQQLPPQPHQQQQQHQQHDLVAAHDDAHARAHAPEQSHQHLDPSNWPTEDQCIICFDPYEKGSQLARLACLHSFHVTCLDTWFDGDHNTCPFCKYNVLQQQDRDTNNSSLVRDDLAVATGVVVTV